MGTEVRGDRGEEESVCVKDDGTGLEGIEETMDK